MIFSKKNSFILICLSIICTTTYAQTSQRTWTVGGNFDLAFNLGSASHAPILNLQPKVGYFPINNLAAGLTGLVEYQKSRRTKIATLGTGVGPFLRYYLKTSKSFSPYISTEVIFTSFSEIEGNRRSISPKSLIRPGAGLAIFLSPHIALENQVTFEYNSIHSYGTGGWSIVQFSVGFQAHLYAKEEK